MNLATDLAIIWTGSLLVADGRSLAFGLQGHILILSLVTSLWVLLGLILRHYDPTYLRPRAEDLGITSLLVASVILVITGSELLLPDGTPMPTLELLVPVVFAPIVALRFTLFRKRYQRDAPAAEAIIVGTGALARATEDSLGARVRIKGFVRVPGDHADVDGRRVLGELPALCQVLVENPVDEVYVAEEAAGNAETLSRVAAVCESLGLAFAVPLPTFRLGRARAAGADDGYVHYWPDELKPYQRAAKRLLDVTVAALALIGLAPLLLVVSALIKLESKGPVFYRQRRVGLHGRTFDMLKFRSMGVDAEAKRAALETLNEQEGPVFKIRNDPRITRVGRFIRRFSIDELPQLFNVLRGEMSLVGPRPPIPTEVDLYETWQRRRLSVRPGITCIWQVSGRNEISFDRWMLLDMQYIDHWSLRLDLKLLVKTIPAVFSARGAS